VRQQPTPRKRVHQQAPPPPPIRQQPTPQQKPQQRTGYHGVPVASQQVAQLSSAAAIDVSHWQGDIDWHQVRADGIRIAMIKVTEDENFVDPKYSQYRREARAAGVVTGAYDFARPGTAHGSVEADARAEARYFLAHADIRKGDIVPTLDLEADGGLTRDQLHRWVNAWMDTVRGATGERPMIYTSPSFWDSEVGGKTDANLWVAHWGVSSPRVPGDWQAWNGWQYTSDGSVNGINGRVDRDRIKNPGSLLVD
jgi:GH25 family lysozyme M1 (1,4-beta-N-acetylmuramidase)